MTDLAAGAAAVWPTQAATSVLANARRIVVKVGSSLVTNEGRGIDANAVGNWCRQLALLAGQGREVVMVSSGAIAEGMKRLGWRTRPDRKSTRLNSSHLRLSRMPSSA